MDAILQRPMVLDAVRITTLLVPILFCTVLDVQGRADECPVQTLFYWWTI